jgi:hypothetical protein
MNTNAIRWRALRTGLDRSIRVLSLVLVLGVSDAMADTSGKGEGALLMGILMGMGTTGGLIGTGSTIILSGAGSTVTILVGVLVGGTAVTGSRLTSILNKEAVNQLKIDHETYLAGGTMTPLLQEVYRRVQQETSFYDCVDPRTGKWSSTRSG